MKKTIFCCKNKGADPPIFCRPSAPPRHLPEIDELSKDTDSRPLYDAAKWGLYRIDRVTPTRPCKVDGDPAMFHRFVDIDRGVLHIKGFVRPSEMSTILENFNKNNFTGPDCNIEKFHSTMALIEWPDGRLCTVAVERVQFTDRRV